MLTFLPNPLGDALSLQCDALSVHCDILVVLFVPASVVAPSAGAVSAPSALSVQAGKGTTVRETEMQRR